MVEVTLGASTSSIVPPATLDEAINITSSEAEHSGKASSSFDSNENVPLQTLIRTRAQRKEAEIMEERER